MCFYNNYFVLGRYPSHFVFYNTKCTTAGGIQVMLKHVALDSVQRVPKQFPSSIQAVPRLVIQDMHKKCPSSTSVVYKECPNSTSVVYKECPNSTSVVYKECPSLYTRCAQIGHWLGHVYISKQFPSLGTRSVTVCSHL